MRGSPLVALIALLLHNNKNTNNNTNDNNKLVFGQRDAHDLGRPMSLRGGRGDAAHLGARAARHQFIPWIRCDSDCLLG